MLTPLPAPKPLAKLYPADPTGYREMMQKVHPGMSVTWHAIVNQDNIPCPGSQSTVTERGTDYLELAAQTGGVTGNI